MEYDKHCVLQKWRKTELSVTNTINTVYHPYLLISIKALRWSRLIETCCEIAYILNV
jgi:hypothetical protein